ncbi:MAG: hypothetical protein LBV14_07585 [Acidovorax sp.]|jgi:hypothetical protein|nr:hypothetical protein [Acidovorax sp.]
MDTAEVTFTVSLCDFDGLPDAARAKAEERYAKTLTRQLGSTEQVCATLQWAQRLEEEPPEEITEEIKTGFARWMKAVRAATEAGMQGLGEGEGSFFEIRSA